MSVKNQLAKNAQAVTTINGNKPALTPEQTIHKYLEAMKGQMALALPKHMTPDRLARIALTTIRTNPKLLACKIESLMGAVMQAAQLGLEPGLLGHCYLVPYKDECTFMIGYKGMIDLARRSGNILSIAANCVYANDYFILKYGLEDVLEHIPYHLRTDEIFEQPGEFKGAYAVAKFTDGGHQIQYLSKNEIITHRDRSDGYKAYKRGIIRSNPWVTDFEEMAKKTVVRSAWKWLPISVEVASKVEASDNAISTGQFNAEGEQEFINISDYEVSNELSPNVETTDNMANATEQQESKTE